MTGAELQRGLPDVPRPTGMVQPAGEQGRRALAAIDKGRLGDAEQHVAAMPEESPVDRAWRLLLRSALAARGDDLSLAKALLLEALSVYESVETQAASESTAEELRVVALVYEKLGWVYRRQDRPPDALAAHSRAFVIRRECGSLEEVWETATSLGVDADLAGRYVDGQSWHRFAVDVGKKAAEEPGKKETIAWTNLSSSLAAAGGYNQAVEAARSAWKCWLDHDMGHINAARSELNLGHMLLKHAESLSATNADQAKGVLDEAAARLESALEGLLAFGPIAGADATWCSEQVDFVRRLRETLES
ncbi:MAG: hypothetical protein JSU63_13605 [Phycisphaerales bacterium]|nr:MAG: hypothetical protein JSU63_13605 [Phycisphaerales bacterium]